MSRRALFVCQNMAEQKTETPSSSPKPARFDGNDLHFYLGLVLLGAGLAFALSWPVAVAIIGGILTLTSMINAYLLLWWGRG